MRCFTCARCGKHWQTPTTEGEANREYLRSGQSGDELLCSVCDECYEYLMSRARSDGLI